MREKKQPTTTVLLQDAISESLHLCSLPSDSWDGRWPGESAPFRWPEFWSQTNYQSSYMQHAQVSPPTCADPRSEGHEGSPRSSTGSGWDQTHQSDCGAGRLNIITPQEGSGDVWITHAATNVCAYVHMQARVCTCVSVTQTSVYIPQPNIYLCATATLQHKAVIRQQ